MRLAPGCVEGMDAVVAIEIANGMRTVPVTAAAVAPEAVASRSPATRSDCRPAVVDVITPTVAPNGSFEKVTVALTAKLPAVTVALIG